MLKAVIVTITQEDLMPKPYKLSNKDLYLLFLSAALLSIIVMTMGCTGSQGDSGIQGLPGVAPIVTTLPASHSECLNGGLEIFINSSETIICNGVNGNDGGLGPQGPGGSPGTPGVDGTPGTVVNMIKICPGVTASYPSSFPEWAIKIGSQLWAVYSANGGFLTLLLPGTYHTTGVGSNCNFTVNNDGTLAY